MNDLRGFRINGEEIAPQAAPADQKLAQWVESLRADAATRSELVTELCLDGVSFAADDPRLALIAADSASLVEVFTRPQAEIALETLEGLIPFLEDTALLCQTLSARTGAERALGFRQLCEGLEILTDAIETAKKILNLQTAEIKTPAGESVAVIEADLLSILQDVADCQARGDQEYLRQLLDDHLPANLRLWARAAIPAMIK